jgi:hypothetical protein
MTAICPVAVVTEQVSTDVNPRSRAWCYIREVLQHAGLFFEEWRTDGLSSLKDRPVRVILLVGDLPLTNAQRGSLSNWVRDGGSLISIGGTSGMDEVLGVAGKKPLAEGWIRVTADDHPVTARLRSSLHVFGGFAATTKDATSLAEIESGSQGARGSAVLENRFGQGRTILLAPDLVFSIVHIQQGLPALQDGAPAPDGSAAINDGELKAEDGLVLDWQRDRTPMQPDGVPAFLEPISDELRSLILRSIFHLAEEQQLRLPVLWYWPRGLPAIGHISHDTDGHDPQKAEVLLDVMNDCGVKSTWCTLYPGGYPREFYKRLQEQGFEIALHYDARSGGPETSWSKENLILQHRWLKEIADLDEITSNKNHYTRWEGRIDFLRWCEAVGIQSDQTRGPSKQGTIGFPLGGSHPYFPLDDEALAPRLLDVLEINMLTQDLVVVCPVEYGRQLMDSVLRQHGVAHFLFHPAHIEKPGVADAIRDLVGYGRSQGLQWWTNKQINHWERLRRGVSATFDEHDRFTLRASAPLRDATLLVLRSPDVAGTIELGGQSATSDVRQFYGFEFDAVNIDLDDDVEVRLR